MKYLRTVLSILLVTLLMAGMFTGCKDEQAAADTTAAQPGKTEEAKEISRDAVGSFIVNAGAIMELYYNADGVIVDAAGKNSDGNTILDNDPQIFGTSCTDAILELLPHFVALKCLENNGNALLLKSTPGSKEPSEAFLTDVATALQENASNNALTLHIFALNGKDLNMDGEMTSAQAMKYLLNALSIAEADYDFINATSYSVQGSYAFQVSQEGIVTDYLVHALTGDIMEGSVDNSFFDGSDLTGNIENELQESEQDEEIEIELPEDTAA